MALTDGILAYWKLDDSSWVDATGNGYTLTDAGINAVPTGDGIINSGAVSNGSAQYLKNDSITVGSSYSVSLWVNVIHDLGLDCIWNLGGVSGPAGVANGGTTYFFLGNVGGDQNLPDIGGLPAGWNHLCYVIDNDSQTQAFYLNGVYQNGNDFSGNFGGWNGFELGAFSARSLYSNSHLDEVGIWDRALTQNDITSLYNLGNAIQYPFEVLYYNNAQEDGDWGNLGNWWLDLSYSTQSTYLPTTETHISVAGNITQNTFFRSVTITGGGGDSDQTYSRNNIGEDLVGDFGYTIYYAGGTTYRVAFDGETLATSTDNCVTWNQTYSTTNRNLDCVCHDAQFNSVNFATGLVLNSSGVVNMQGSSVFSGTATDSISLHDTSYIDIPAIIGGDATLRDSSLNTGTINGNATVYSDGGNGTYPIGGTVLGEVTYIGFNFGETCYFSQIENGYLANANNWFLDAERTIPALFAPDDRNDVVFSGMETITGITGNANESITYKSISCDGVVFSGAEVTSFTVIATNGITAIGSLFRSVTIEANGSYTNCTLADDTGSANLVGNIVLHSCIGIYTHDADSPAIASFNGNIDAYYPTSIISGAVTGTLTRHGYGLQQVCSSHCHLDETSGTREFLDLYEETFLSGLVLSGSGVVGVDGTYTRTSGGYTSFIGPNGNSISWNSDPDILLWELYSATVYYQSGDLSTWTSTNALYDPPPSTDNQLTSPISVGYGSGLIRNAAKFDGNSLINDTYELIAEFSISVWVNFPVVPTDTSDCIVGAGQTYGENFTIYGNNSRIRLYFDSSASADLQSDPISANTWYHCVLTVTLDAIKFYVNGEYIGEKTDVHLVNSGGFALSKFFGGNTLHDNALVDELNIFNIELNQTQVNKLYNNGLGLGYPFNIAGAKKIDLYKLLGIPFPANDYKYSRLLNLPFFVKI